MVNPVVFRLVTVGVLIVSAVFCVLCTAGNYWMVHEKESNLHEGLWKKCIGNGEICTDIEPEVYTRTATKTLMVISCVAYLFGFGYILLLYVAKDLNIKFLAVILAITFILEVVGLSIYTGNNKLGGRVGWEFGWAYVLGWCSSIFTFIAGVLCFLDNGYQRLE